MVLLNVGSTIINLDYVVDVDWYSTDDPEEQEPDDPVLESTLDAIRVRLAVPHGTVEYLFTADDADRVWAALAAHAITCDRVLAHINVIREP